MDTQELKSFNIIGIAVRTTNENGQAGIDIPVLWDKFISEGIADKIPGKVDNTVYSVYTEYEGDFTKPYTTVLGCKVNTADTIPEGMKGIVIEKGTYIKRTTGVDKVFEEWTKIWNSDIPRIYTTDFEAYGEKAQNPEEAAVEIFIAVK
ncbi:Predicted transcriptional regulator YdeE, contains AraC-type DNA-binding domain [Chitinophaga sp. YR573]|uniref:GyrI-like domain-containing protein n=1 Tax=Chitinophaga sp. YR573 TaxID=1881040 RepID=UPI0008D47E58|nr:effector binding domain-containing protein [Chitinophaga sp. YR573]SEW37859.1 Predicted transcriptional regulator YdeE, contains AraC-type DNA-binding domain [Chitinophaga sp. YR573]